MRVQVSPLAPLLISYRGYDMDDNTIQVPPRDVLTKAEFKLGCGITGTIEQTDSPDVVRFVLDNRQYAVHPIELYQLSVLAKSIVDSSR